MSGTSNRRQKRMGPAPFASFEDLSDEVRSRLESPEDRTSTSAVSLVRLPGIREDATPTPSNTPAPLEGPEFVYTGISLVGALTSTSAVRLQPAAPRIDISRASSSSHHDSKESTPEMYEAHDPTTAKLGLGFREEGALDLRSSTEELDFGQDADKSKSSRMAGPRAQSPLMLHHERKDSQSSELGLLCISGRTSRLSSIGSQGSGQSRLSNASHLSVLSGASGLSRSPSPHKMLLETSFCGNKTPELPAKHAFVEDAGTKSDEMLELVLLSRKQDPTQAVLAEGIKLDKKPLAPEKPIRKKLSPVNKPTDITIKIDEPPPTSNKQQIARSSHHIPKKIISKSGVEYIYIPLKGPLPVDAKTAPTETVRTSQIREVKSADITRTKPIVVQSKLVSKSATPSPVTQHRTTEPKYIRIKLKPDYMYSQEDGTCQKPDSLDLTDRIEVVEEVRIEQKSLASTPSASPKLPRLKDSIGSSKTPSPSLSRKSSFASIFRSKEHIVSPESPTVSTRRKPHSISGILRDASESLTRTRSRSKSRERGGEKSAPSSTESIDSKTKQKSVFSIFKAKKETRKDATETISTVDNFDGIAKVEFKFNDSTKSRHETPLQGDSIRIPLHSPTHYEERSILQEGKTDSQESQDTVIEVCQKRVVVEKPTDISEQIELSVEIEAKPLGIEETSNHCPKINESKPVDRRQSSTSSENVVFTTKLGSNNEIFCTKLPKSHDEDKRNTNAAEDERNSSDSEASDLAKPKKDLLDLKLDLECAEPERKGLVLQQDSYEDELPYIPTTLPQERSAAVPIVPVKQRSTFEMKTCPIDRPRSTTPINPSCLEEYCEDVMGKINSETVTKTIEKLKISLPRHDSMKSPRKPSSGNTNWADFAEKNIIASGGRRSSQDNDTPPPLPPKGVPQQQNEWINFEEIPERRKPPKRIQTLPSRGHIEVPESVLHDAVVYNYVNPEECKCECHENKRGVDSISKTNEVVEAELQQAILQAEDEVPLLDDDDENKIERLRLDTSFSDRRSVVSDSSIDLSAVEPPLPASSEAANGNVTLRTPFTSDLGVSSNRSSITSQDEPQSPESPNAFPKSFKPY